MKKMRSFLRKVEERKGFALTEMILAVLVLAGMLIVAWNLYSRIRDSNLTSTAKQYLLSAVTQVQSIYKSEAYDFTSFTSDATGAKWVELNIWPKEYLRNKKLINGWGGTITMATQNSGQTFSIQFTNVPKTPCVELGTFGTEWFSVKIGTQEFTQAAGKIPVAAASAIAACTSNNNTIVWTAN